MAEAMLSGRLAIGLRGTPEDLVADLKQLGFTDYEGRIYVQLLRQKEPGTAYEVSKNAGVPRPNAYNALETLTQRGAVLPVSAAPTRYVAAPPQELFGAIARRTERLCADLGSRLAALAVPVDNQHVWTLSGPHAVHEKIDRLIEGAREMLMIKAPGDILRRHRAALVGAGAREVAMLIVVFGDDASEFTFGPRCSTYIHEGSGMRMGSTDNLFTIAADHTEMVTASLSDEVLAVHTRNKPIVNLAESLIRHDFYMAEIFLRFGKEIEAAFGPYLRDLRLRCFTPEQAASFRQKTGV